MCRHLGYLGPPTPVGDLLTRGDHSLRTQAWAPRDMRGGGTINADGFGVAWWAPAPGRETENIGARAHGGPLDGRGSGGAPTSAAGSVTTRYRNPAPIWSDPAVDEVLPQLNSHAVLAAVRSATVGMPVERTACAPFTHGRWAFSHNGVIQDWQATLTAVAARFDAPPLIEAESRTDSATFWVILRGLLDREADRNVAEPAPAARTHSAPDVRAHSAPGARAESARDDRAGSARDVPGDIGATGNVEVLSPSPARQPDRVAAILREAALAVLVHAPNARLNLLLGDGETLWATTVHHALSVLVTEEIAVIASEPYDDDPRWRAIPDRRLVTARPGTLTVAPLDPDESERPTS
ncbi:ergothioneine biosynthesis protein EgtC [Nocardia sp. NPDC004068]|uniref:ergothioneine biosynthesis protein EgtC n=1 Tax=Nocardia sp. NPDC004068 TaxID=3364303 RepID=UPI0036C79607